MTQQLKFGDRVQDTEGRQFIFLRGYLSCCTVASSDGKTYVYLLDKIYPCATEPHPDTARLDSMRDAIDAAMRIQAEAV